MLTILDEILSIRFAMYDIYVPIEKGMSNIDVAKQFLRSLYFEVITDPTKVTHINSDMNLSSYILYKSKIPISISSCIFMWTYEHGDLEKYCQHMIACLINGWENRPKYLNVTMSNTRYILDDVFPGDISNKKQYSIYKDIVLNKSCFNISNDGNHIPLEIGEGVNDDILQKLLLNVRTSPPPLHDDDYLQGLMVVDLGYGKNHLLEIKDKDDKDDKDYKIDEITTNVIIGIDDCIMMRHSRNMYTKHTKKQKVIVYFLMQLMPFFLMQNNIYCYVI